MDKKISAKFDLIQKAYADNLPKKIAQLEHAWQDVDFSSSKEGLVNLRFLCHTLRGSTGTYGYMALSEALRDLEFYLTELINYHVLNKDHQKDINNLLEKCKQASLIKQEISTPFVAQKKERALSQVIIYLNPEETRFTHALQDCLKDKGYQLLILKTFSEFQKTTETVIPHAIIIDEIYLNDHRIGRLTEYKNTHEQPLFCFASHNDVEKRLKAIRLGVSGFFLKSMDPAYLAKQLLKSQESLAYNDYRVLIIDDDEALAEYHALLLQEVGMVTFTLSEPFQLIETLHEFNPNIVLMDLYLPQCSGLELAMMIRQEERYTNLPIIFISSEEDRHKQLYIMNASGGDEFLTKPVLPEVLINAVKTRGKRSALLSSYLSHELLTDLLTQDFILKQLQIELAKADRKHQELSLALLEVNDLENINKQFGHSKEDMVIKKIADLLRVIISPANYIGRFDDKYILIIFPDTPLKKAETICKKIEKEVADHIFKKHPVEFHVTVNIGLVDFPTFQDSKEMMAGVIQALKKVDKKKRKKDHQGT